MAIITDSSSSSKQVSEEEDASTMVQLKSFRYIEPDRELAETTIGSSSSSSSSSSSISTITGGNLTNSESSVPAKDAANTNDEATTTLSSGEEYQTAEHNLTEDDLVDELANEEESNDQVGDLTTTCIDIGTGRPLAGMVSAQVSQVAQQQHQHRGHLNQLPASPRTPMSPRLKLYIAQQQRAPTDSPVQGRYKSPTMSRNGHSNDDLASQSPNYGNHFEIRWQNLTLRARRDKRPKALVENPLYKLLFGSQSSKPDDEKSDSRLCYSPPLGHKQLQRPITTTTTTTTSDSPKILQKSPSKEDMFLPKIQQPILSENSDEFRTILNNVSGAVFSGQLTAILGPSGVGKTMLLNSLTGRNTLDGIGRVSLIGGASKRMSVVTVPQEDVLPGKLTTIEDLRFTSRLKNPQPGFNHERNIQRIVRHLKMEKFLETRIDKLSGGEERRLSIARELLSSPDIMILDEPTSGLDANTCKKIITALRDIVEHSDNILGRPMSIIVTIHQPQQEVYNLFHRIYVMAIGGRAIYEGPPSCLLPSLLEQSSLSKECAVDQLNDNPAIVALEVASGEYGPKIIEELADFHENQVQEEFILYGDNNSAAANQTPLSTPRTFGSPRKKSPFVSASPRFDFTNRISRARMTTPDNSIGRPTPLMAKRALNSAGGLVGDQMSSITSLSYASSYDADLPEPIGKLKVDKRLRRSVVMKSHFFSHTWTLMQRCWLLTTRDMFLMMIRIIGFLGVAGGMVQIFSEALDPDEHVCPDYATEVDDVISFMASTRERLSHTSSMLRQSNSTHLFFFHFLLCVTMVTSALSGLVFPLQMRMFIREYKNGWYSPASFITSATLAELPVDIIGPILSLVITYPLCNQPSSAYHWRELGYIIVTVISCVICKSQAQIVGAFLMDSVENSVFISCVMVTPPALLSGIAVRVSQMSLPLQWASYVSFLRYAFESLFSLRYGYGICPCDPELVTGYPIKTTTNAIPPQLDNLARGILDLNSNITLSPLPEDSLMNSTSAFDSILEGESTNLFIRFIRLVTDASNLFIQDPTQLGDCSRYRSLYLMDMGIPNNVLPKWITIMFLMFIISRFLTYFVVKTVIKLRKH